MLVLPKPWRRQTPTPNSHSNSILIWWRYGNFQAPSVLPGFQKANRDNIRRTSKRKVKSACLITGQQQPTQDVALFTRCIVLSFPPRERSPVQNAQADRVVRIQQTGQLSAITIELLKFRDLVEEKFELEFEAIRSMFKFSLKKCDQQVQDRLLYNHLIPVTIMAILANHLDFGWKYEALADFALENLIAQQQAIYNEDELTVWWRIIQYLVDRFDLRHGADIQVEEKSSEKFYSLTTNSDSEVWTWEESKRLLYFRFTTAHQIDTSPLL